MQQASKLDTFALGNRSLKSRHTTIGRFGLTGNASDEHDDHRRVVDRDRVPSESVLDDVAENKRRHPGQAFKLRDRFAQVFFLQVIEIKGIEFLEDPLKSRLQPAGCFLTVRQTGQHAGEFTDRGDADFIPVEIVLL